MNDKKLIKSDCDKITSDFLRIIGPPLSECYSCRTSFYTEKINTCLECEIDFCDKCMPSHYSKECSVLKEINNDLI